MLDKELFSFFCMLFSFHRIHYYYLVYFIFKQSKTLFTRAIGAFRPWQVCQLLLMFEQAERSPRT